MAERPGDAHDYWRQPPTGPPVSELPVNRRINFIPTVTTGPDAELIRRLTNPECQLVIGSINRGIPMPVYILDALLQVQVRHAFLKIRVLVERAVSLVTLINHYSVSRLVYLHGDTQRQRAFSGPNRERLERGFERLERALREDVRSEELLDTVYEGDLPDGRAEQVLIHLYALAGRAGCPVPGPELAESSRCLGLFNYCFRVPRFTGTVAIYTYAEALATITRLDEVPLPLLSAIRRSRDPEDILNDLIFGTALGNALIRQRRCLIDMEQSIRTRLARLLTDCYYIYTQVPSAWAEFARLAAVAVEVANVGELEDYDFRRLTRPLFRFIRAIAAADVYACPDFIQEQLLALGPVTRDPEDDGPEPVELDPMSIQPYTPYREHNPYNDPQVFRCPRQPAAALNHLLHMYPRTVRVLDEVTSDMHLAFRLVEVRDPELYIHEGMARALRVTQETLEEQTSPSAPPTALDPAHERATLADRLFYFPDDPQVGPGPSSPTATTANLWSGAEPVSAMARLHRPSRTHRPPLNQPEPEDDEDPMLYLAHSVSRVQLARPPDRRRRRDRRSDPDPMD